MLIDAHCHLWRIGRNGQVWPGPDLPAIHRDFQLADLTEAARGTGLSGVVLVQSQPDHRDTRWLLELAATEPLVLGVVGWTDLAAPDAPSAIAQLALNPALKGLRPMLQDLPPDWILDPALEPAIAAMVQADLSFDALIRPAHITAITTLVQRWPALRVVVDHGAKPMIAKGSWQPWASALRALAAQPGVHCKLSGLLTEALMPADAAMVAPYARYLLDIFGEDRLMWGSDWPVVNLADDYAGWHRMCRSWAPVGRHASLFANNARRFYRLCPHS